MQYYYIYFALYLLHGNHKVLSGKYRNTLNTVWWIKTLYSHCAWNWTFARLQVLVSPSFNWRRNITLEIRSFCITNKCCNSWGKKAPRPKQSSPSWCPIRVHSQVHLENTGPGPWIPKSKQITQTFSFYSTVCFILLLAQQLALDCTETASSYFVCFLVQWVKQFHG